MRPDLPATIDAARKAALNPEAGLLLALQRQTITRRQLLAAQQAYQKAADLISTLLPQQP